jgi:hypothetical protein
MRIVVTCLIAVALSASAGEPAAAQEKSLIIQNGKAAPATKKTVTAGEDKGAAGGEKALIIQNGKATPSTKKALIIENGKQRAP